MSVCTRRRAGISRGAASPAGPESLTKDHEAELTDADMPPIESLGPDSDFSVFMGRRVSEELRRMALRKLFQLPQYQVRCTLNEYEGNFNDFLPLGDVVTHEMREMLLRQLRQTRAAGDEESNAAPAAAEKSAAAEPVANAEEPDGTAAPTHDSEVG